MRVLATVLYEDSMRPNAGGCYPLHSLLAGSGSLYVLLDRDRIARHLDLPPSATDGRVVQALGRKCNSPEKLRPFFLRPNTEGLLRSIQACDPLLLPDSMEAALKKRLNERDIVFDEVRRAERRSVRECVRQAQPGLDGLARALARSLSSEVTR
jgi:hypothetical protein